MRLFSLLPLRVRSTFFIFGPLQAKKAFRAESVTLGALRAHVASTQLTFESGSPATEVANSDLHLSLSDNVSKYFRMRLAAGLCLGILMRYE